MVSVKYCLFMLHFVVILVNNVDHACGEVTKQTSYTPTQNSKRNTFLI